VASNLAEPVVSGRAEARVIGRFLVAMALSVGAAFADEAPLPDIVQGSPMAPVSIIEYASMTCPHCAAFHEKTWPELKRKYIDTGKAKFTLREFPLDPLAVAAFMLGRCAGAEKRDALLDKLFADQKTWAFVEKPAGPLQAEAKAFGLGDAEIDKCLKDETLYNRVVESRERGEGMYHVRSTPTFLVNGRELTGELTIADFDKAMGMSAH
jgi:protein-disulfide isomerase